jgi:hypothetical protein
LVPPTEHREEKSPTAATEKSLKWSSRESREVSNPSGTINKARNTSLEVIWDRISIKKNNYLLFCIKSKSVSALNIPVSPLFFKLTLQRCIPNIFLL